MNHNRTDTATSQGRGNILIVDDNPEDLRLLSQMLVSQRYEVRTVTDGSQALAVVYSNLPDLILLDIKMPEMDGYQVCQHLKADEQTRDIPVIFISALEETQDKVKAFTIGGVDYITKPFQIKEVLARVKTHLALRNVQKQLQVANDELERRLQELARSEANYREIFNSANDAIAIHDIKIGQVLDVNQRMCEMYGYTKAEARKLGVGDLYAGEPPYTQQEALQWIEKAAKGQPQLFEWQCKDKAGGLFWAEVNLKRVFIGGEDRVLAVIRDITERKRAEKALRDSEERLRWLVENAEDIIFLQDLEGRYLYYNGPSRYGLTVDDVLGKTSFDLHEPAAAAKVMAELEQVTSSGKAHTFENNIVWQGESLWFIDHKYPVKDAERRIVGVGTISRNITDRKQAEEQIRAALQEKEAMLAEIHHRVKNNLQIVSSLLNFQADYAQDEQTLEIIRDTQRRVKSMALIHEQLYRAPDLAQIDFTKYVQDLVSGLFAAYRTNAGYIALRLDIGTVYLPIKKAIPCGLLINELVSNALKYAFPPDRDRSPELVDEIRVAFHPGEEGEYTLTVSDNGVGLPPDFTFPNEHTLGMRLIDIFTQQLEGAIKWHSEAGTTCQITFGS